ncbi:MAG: RagB/SusD family nutrient uptake outer membrane protein [Paludibacteraceae bacterium]|nr:RagB/SusD family nutrient uptake outer membrane protein [Paludibacteraceae bacterium]
MKNISKILVALMLSVGVFSSCDDLLSVDSDRFISADDHNMNAANDTLYSMFGVFSQLQKLADSYVLLGELRADLMDVTDSADVYLKEIYNHNVSPGNPYVNLKAYYAVINNCNYILHKIDTTQIIKGEKAMLKTYAAAKAIRAWTYMQIALNFDKATYYEVPILSIDEAFATYPEYTMEELAPRLIADLEPYRTVPYPDFAEGVIPVRFILGDLYLWSGTYANSSHFYELAATEYHQLMKEEFFVVRDRSSYATTNNAFTGVYSAYSLFNSPQIMGVIISSNQYGNDYKMDTLVQNLSLTASQKSIDYWMEQRYIHNATVDTLGDLRMKVSALKVSSYDQTSITHANSGRYTLVKLMDLNYSNDRNSTKQTPVYRVSQLYLRYAEALNRLGKPNAAMAVLKYGMTSATLANRRFIPGKEMIPDVRETIIPSKLDPLVDSVRYDTTYSAPAYMDFSDMRFNVNIGVHARGCGNTQMDTTYYRIPAIAYSATSAQDSVLYVEDMIQKELALEMAFEGNRFHDLMRFAIRRNDNAYLADIVSAKYPDAAAMRSRLLDRTNWYLKK